MFIDHLGNCGSFLFSREWRRVKKVSAIHKKSPARARLSYCFDEISISPSQADLRSRRNRHSCIHAVERRECKAGFSEKA
jgi:hypothetical protein